LVILEISEGEREVNNSILHCGVCGNPLDVNISILETKPIKENPSSNINSKDWSKDWYTYVVLPCYCQYDNRIILKYYLTAPEWYELIRLIKDGD